MVQLNGIAHVQLTVSDVERSTRFYEPLLGFFEMKTLIKSPQYFYAIGSRTGVALSPVDPERRDEAFEQRRVGLHHLCFRARSREDVDQIWSFVKTLEGVELVHGPQEDQWAPGYYSILFEDPDGIRLEVNFVPGKGHLDSASEGVPGVGSNGGT